MKFNPLPWIALLAVLSVAIWIRYDLVEQNELGFYCDGGGSGWRCQVRWLAIQAFNSYSLGYFGLVLGVLAFLTRSATAGLAAAATGMAGLILYTWDYSAVGFLLGSLTMARAQLEEYRYQHGTGQSQT